MSCWYNQVCRQGKQGALPCFWKIMISTQLLVLTKQPHSLWKDQSPLEHYKPELQIEFHCNFLRGMDSYWPSDYTTLCCPASEFCIVGPSAMWTRWVPCISLLKLYSPASLGKKGGRWSNEWALRTTVAPQPYYGDCGLLRNVVQKISLAED